MKRKGGGEREEKEKGNEKPFFLFSLFLFAASFDTGHPTVPLAILRPQNQDIGELYAVRKRRSTDFKASKLRKSQSGVETGKIGGDESGACFYMAGWLARI